MFILMVLNTILAMPYKLHLSAKRASSVQTKRKHFIIQCFKTTTAPMSLRQKRAEVTALSVCPMWPDFRKTMYSSELRETNHFSMPLKLCYVVCDVWQFKRSFLLLFVLKLMKYDIMKTTQPTVAFLTQSSWTLAKTHKLNIVELLLHISSYQN